MIQSMQDRVVRFAYDYPATGYVLAIGGLTAAAARLQARHRAEQAASRDAEKARREKEQDAAQPRYGHGSLLDGLTVVAPTMEASSCERLGTFVGFAVPGQNEATRNFSELLRACRRLPATIDHCPRLQRQIDALRAKVAALSGTHYSVQARDDGLDTIDALWKEAFQLRKRVKAEYERRARVAGPSSMENIDNTAAAYPFTGLATPTGDPDDEAPADDPSRTQGLKRRHLSTRPFETPITPAATAVEPFRLSPAQCRTLRAAINYAWERSDGNGRVTHNEQRRLGVTITGLIGGSYPTHTSHGGPLDRSYDIHHVLTTATARMPPWHRDAIRKVGGDHLRKLQNA